MPIGDKSAYTDKQKRKAEHIEEGYEKQGLSPKAAAARAWATVNKQDGGGKASGSGRGKTSKKPTGKKRAAKSTVTSSSTRKKSSTKKASKK